MINYKLFTVGIEEEYMVIDPTSKELISHEQKIVIEGQKVFGEKVKAEMGNITVNLNSSTSKPLNQTSTNWGSVYWQYFEDLDKITSAETPLKLKKQFTKQSM